MRGLTTDMTRGALRPYFLWDEDVSIDELRSALHGPDPLVRDRLFGKMLREARDLDVWSFVTPADVAAALSRLQRRIGRRYGFWSFLIQGWRSDASSPQYQLHPEKLERDGIVVDPADEILANKLTTLVSRAEERDLVDVLCLERAGYRVEDALPAALAKDGGCTPAVLAWLLSEVSIPDGMRLPAELSPGDLKAFIADLITRLRRAALPT